MNSYYTQIVLFTFMCVLVNVSMGYSENQSNVIALLDNTVLTNINPEIQKRLRQFSVSSETDRKFKTNKEEAIREWSDIDRPELAQQILIFLGTNRFTNEREAWRIAGLFNALKFTEEEKMTAILPILGTSDVALQKTLYGELKSIDERENGRCHDFSQFSALISQRKDDPPSALLRYMFDRDPKVAVLSLSRIYGDKDTESQLADQLKGDLKAAVQSLAGRPEWWAHLYVATMMEKEPYLRTPELIKKLEADTDPLVREKMSKLKEKLQPK